ncbi:MAG: methylmalonyl-CoA mutase, partial [Bacteroidetes bacterium QH_7_62_13]
DLGPSAIDEVLRWESIEGVSLLGNLRREDLEATEHVDPEAGTPPLVNSDAVPANDWDICQPIAHPDPEEANRLARGAVRKGADALALVRPAAPEHTTGGILIETIDDLRTVLAGLPLSEIALHLENGPSGAILLGAVQEIAEEENVADTLQGSVSYDPVAALAAGTVRDVSVAFDPLSDTLHNLSDRGHSVRPLPPRLHFLTSVSTSYFVEIAKHRALRLLVPQVVEAYATDTDEDDHVAPGDLEVQAETSRRTETVYDPYVNMLRGTTEGMAAVIGGCDVLRVRPYDAALRPQDTFGSRIARNVQLILREEAHMDAVADPGAGSYYLEAATDQLARRAWNKFQGLEAEGGLLSGLREGRVQERIREVREDRREQVNSRRRVLVGTNHYPNLNETRRDDLTSTPSLDREESEALVGEVSIGAFRHALQGPSQMSELLAKLSEDPADIEPLRGERIANDIETLRLRTERYATETGHVPTVFLAPLGSPKMRSARANFARNVFGVAGFEVDKPLKFETPADAAVAAAEADADIVVLCSADEEYSEFTPALRSALDDQGLSPLLVVAGAPGGVNADVPADDFIHRGNLLLEKLEAFQESLGIRDEEAPTND